MAPDIFVHRFNYLIFQDRGMHAESRLFFFMVYYQTLLAGVNAFSPCLADIESCERIWDAELRMVQKKMTHDFYRIRKAGEKITVLAKYRAHFESNTSRTCRRSSFISKGLLAKPRAANWKESFSEESAG
jgi:hypothetical protein